MKAHRKEGAEIVLPHVSGLADSTPEYNGALPVHVRLMMDEFANVALPKNFKNILAVCRSRNISCDIILQNIAQLKSLFKDDWEGIIGNCDTLLYLGGNEYGTYEYLSKILGRETERTKSQSIGKGSRGSSNDSLQTAGRELCVPDEIRRMRDDECLLLMRSEDPVIDKKYNLLHHPNVKYTPDAGGEPYVMPPDYISHTDIQIITDAFKRYAGRKDKNIPLLSEYAHQLRVEKRLRPYLEVLL